MATSSFSNPLIIRSDEAAKALLDAMEHPTPIKHIDMRAELERGREAIKRRYE